MKRLLLCLLLVSNSLLADSPGALSDHRKINEIEKAKHRVIDSTPLGLLDLIDKRLERIDERLEKKLEIEIDEYKQYPECVPQDLYLEQYDYFESLQK
tara:strand:+ start:2660 stop:2953 length:294 start_codon:yes stop_codon:yes gene_type:complete